MNEKIEFVKGLAYMHKQCAPYNYVIRLTNNLLSNSSNCSKPVREKVGICDIHWRKLQTGSLFVTFTMKSKL